MGRAFLGGGGNVVQRYDEALETPPPATHGWQPVALGWCLHSEAVLPSEYGVGGGDGSFTNYDVLSQ